MARALFKSWFVDFDPVRAKADGRAPAGMSAELAALFPDSFSLPYRKYVPLYDDMQLAIRATHDKLPA
jgi:type I restriction enzyme S subunit